MLNLNELFNSLNNNRGKTNKLHYYHRITNILGGEVTVFRSEVFAMKQCGLESLRKGYFDRHITIFSKSEAALKTLEYNRINSKLVIECLQVIGKMNFLKLKWLPGDAGVASNEKADQFAREGCNMAVNECSLPLRNKQLDIQREWTREERVRK